MPNLCLHLPDKYLLVRRFFKKKKETKEVKMSSTQGTLLDVLKKKMRQTKEEAERFQEEAEEYRKKLQIEIRRREEVSFG